MYSTKEKS